ncbi:MAG: phosphate ABC transporter permease subunit PstC [Alkalinema sp. CACIAM 70d]|nr:MAG: phosphate ABC transporter permease subunit PstC [Alkalinema sp. CACIAM 70d]
MARSLPSLAASVQQSQRRRSVRQIQEKVIESILFLAAFSCVAVTIAIMVILGVESFGLFQQVSIGEFLTGIEWAPLFEPPKYGVLPLITGTLTTTLVALSVAIPLGTTIALFLSEFASATVREWTKPILELLAGIPTVVYGYFALLFITPLLQALLPDLGGFNMLSAGMVMGIMITPLISSISEDALRSVPAELREGSYATGATRLQTAYKVVFPAALSGVSSSYILGISRAVGETMIVAIAAGLQPTLTFNPLDSAATMTAYIVQVSLGDLPHGTTGYQTIFAVGLTLVLITLVFNIIGHFLSKRYRERY